MNKIIVLLITLSGIFLSCNSRREYYLTNNSCKYWRTSYSHRENKEKYYERTMGFKLCANKEGVWCFFRKNGEIEEWNYLPATLDSDKKWYFVGSDTLVIADQPLKILYIGNDSLVVVNEDELIIHLKPEYVSNGTWGR